VRSWLLTIARNTAIDAVGRRREQPYEPAVLLTMIGAAGDRRLDAIADADQLRTALRRLPREQAAAVALATVYGLSTREVAAHQRVPLGTAKTRIRLGLARLRNQLGADAA
jgi:RNA polymerase sigma factor (sigma-70 family)